MKNYTKKCYYTKKDNKDEAQRMACKINLHWKAREEKINNKDEPVWSKRLSS